MIDLLSQGRFALFALILLALVLSLCLHEFGHALAAKLYGDDTAQRAGRLTLNPIAHIDPMGLLMVILVGFGYAKPVPTDPRKFKSRSGDVVVSAAGPAMNLFLAALSINLYLLGLQLGFDELRQPGPQFFFVYLAQINLILMVFNLIPLGALDGHYILPYFLPEQLALRYRYYNARYGNFVLLGFIVLSIMGLPIFKYILAISNYLLPLIIFV
ncbi:MAG: site-2 protease family protein [Gammaproteobacteria bacterium]|nr:site-2 protease family protein [Gammaproteobacteria bacterium]MDX2460586.1 site-2 protease family protein [Gammaproteobacteria bacterium]